MSLLLHSIINNSFWSWLNYKTNIKLHLLIWELPFSLDLTKTAFKVWKFYTSVICNTLTTTTTEKIQYRFHGVSEMFLTLMNVFNNFLIVRYFHQESKRKICSQTWFQETNCSTVVVRKEFLLLVYYFKIRYTTFTTSSKASALTTCTDRINWIDLLASSAVEIAVCIYV